MTTAEKRAFVLLQSLIFHYHGLDSDEELLLEKTAAELGDPEAVKWANDFIAKDVYTSFDRARDLLNEVIGPMPKNKRFEYLSKVWDANNAKGYITEVEATAMLKLANDWDIEEELISMAKGVS